MATLGRSPGAAPLTSADIPDDSITAAKIVAGAVSSDVVYLENNTSTQTLSGTYSTERLYFNDSYQLTGNVTVTGHLALGTIADEDVVITQDSTERTITGEGTLEAGNVLQDTHRTSLTDMTGELGSAVTGGSGLNVNSGVTVADQWVLTSVLSPSGSEFIISGWDRPSVKPSGFGTGWKGKGTGLSLNLGVFSFFTTGLYVLHITVVAREDTGGDDANAGLTAQVSVDNGGSWTPTLIARTHHSNSAVNGCNSSASNMGFINVTAISGGSAVKLTFKTDSVTSGNKIYGDTSTLNTGFTIFRLGDSQ